MNEEEFLSLIGQEPEEEESQSFTEDDFLSLIGDTKSVETQEKQTVEKPQSQSYNYDNPILNVIAEKVDNYNLNPTFMQAIAKHESGLDPTAVSHTGAKGLFQFIPSTAKQYGIDPNNPEQSAEAAAKFVDRLDKKYDGDVNKILAAYNAGSGVVDEAIKIANNKGTDWNDEIINTFSLGGVAEKIKKYSNNERIKNMSVDEIKQQKYNEILQHRRGVMNAYDELSNLYGQQFVEQETTTEEPNEFEQFMSGLLVDETQQEQVEGVSFGEAAGASFKGNLANLASSINRLPRGVAEIALGGGSIANKILNVVPGVNLPTGDQRGFLDKYFGDSPATEELEEIEKKNQEKVQKYIGPDNVVKLLSEGKTNDAAKRVAINAIGQIPQLAGIIAGSVVGVPQATMVGGLGAITATGQMDEYWDKVDQGLTEQNFEAATLNAFFNGVIEGVFESTGSVQITRPLRQLFSIMSKEFGEKTAKKIMGNSIGRILGKVKNSMKEEAIEEFSAGFAQTFSNKIFGSDPDATFMDALGEGIEGATTAIATGGGLGVVSSIPTEVVAHRRKNNLEPLEVVDSETGEYLGTIEEVTTPENIDEISAEEQDLTQEEQQELGIVEPTETPLEAQETDETTQTTTDEVSEPTEPSMDVTEEIVVDEQPTDTESIQLRDTKRTNVVKQGGKIIKQYKQGAAEKDVSVYNKLKDTNIIPETKQIDENTVEVDFVEGQDAGNIISEDNQNAENIVTKLAETLATIHNNDVLHNDFHIGFENNEKSREGNVIIDTDGNVKVIDWESSNIKGETEDGVTFNEDIFNEESTKEVEDFIDTQLPTKYKELFTNIYNNKRNKDIDTQVDSELTVLEGTDADVDHGNEIASKIDNVSFDGIQQGVKSARKTIEPSLQFTIRDKGKETSFYAPLSATVEEVNQKYRETLETFKPTETPLEAQETDGGTVDTQEQVSGTTEAPKSITDNTEIFNKIISEKKATIEELDQLPVEQIRNIATNLDIPSKGKSGRFRKNFKLVEEIVEKIGTPDSKTVVKERAQERKTKTGEASKKGRKQQANKRFEETGDERTPKQMADVNAMREILSEGFVPYNQDKHKNLLNKRTSKKGSSINLFKKETIDGVEYITTNINPRTDTGKKINVDIDKEILNSIEKLNTRSYIEEVNYDDNQTTEDDKTIEDRSVSATEVVSEGVAEDTAEFDKVERLTKKAKNKIDSDLKEGLISKTEYDSRLEEIEIYATSVLKSDSLSIQKDGSIRLRNKMKRGDNRSLTVKSVRDIFKLFGKDKFQIAFGNPKSPARYKGKPVDTFMEENSEVYGGFTITDDGTALITINTNHPDSMGTLIHEAIGHFGAFKVFQKFPELESYARDLFRRDEGSDLRVAIRLEYGENIEEQFQEWVATNVEKIGTKFFNKDGSLNQEVIQETEGVVKKLFNKIREILGKILNTKPESKEIDDLVSAIFYKVQELQDIPAIVSEAGDAKRQRDLSKPFSEREKIRLKNKIKARTLLETAKSLKGTKNRILRFALNHVYTSGDKQRLIKLVNKANTNDRQNGRFVDKNLQKAIDLIDRASYRGDLSRAVTKFNRASRGLKTKSPDQIKFLINQLTPILEKVNEFRRLDIMYERTSYDAPLNSDGSVKIGPTLGQLLENGYVEIRTNPETNDKRVAFTAKGKKRYKQLKRGFEKLKLEDEIVDVLTYIEAKTYELQELKSQFSDVKNGIKKEKSEKIQKKAQRLIDQAIEYFNEKPDVVDMKFRDVILKKIKDALKTFDLSTVNLEYILNSLDNFDDDGVFKKIVLEPIIEGENKKNEFKKNSIELFQKEISEIKDIATFSEAFTKGLPNFFRNLKRNEKTEVEKTTYTDINGQKFSISKDQRVAIARISESRDGIRHLLSENGGIVLEENSNKVFKLSPQILRDILQDMTVSEKQLARAVGKYFEFQGDEINKVSMKDLGYKLADEENYHPLRTKALTQKYKDQETTLNSFQEFTREAKFNNLKMRKKGSNPIVLEGSIEAMARTNEMVSDYIGMALPIRDIKRLIDDNSAVVKANGKKTTFRDFMIENGKEQELKIIKTILNQIDGTGRERSFRGVVNIFKFFRKLKTVGVLGYNPNVFFLQPLSYVNIWTQGISSFNIFNHKENRRNLSDFIEHSPFLWERYNGAIDRDIGEYMSQASARNMVFPKKGIKKFSERTMEDFVTGEGIMSWITLSDSVAISAVCTDVRKELEKQGYKYDTPEFWDKATKRLETIIRRTQPTFGSAHRPIITNIELLKPLTMFTSQPIKNLMMVRTGINKLKKGIQNKDTKSQMEGIRDLSVVLILQPLLVTTLREGIRTLRGKGEDEEWWKKMLFGYIGANAGMYPLIGGLISSFIRGYPVSGEQPVVESLKTFLGLSNRLTKYAKGVATYKDDEQLRKELVRALSTVGQPATGLSHMYEIIANTTEKLDEMRE